MNEKETRSRLLKRMCIHKYNWVLPALPALLALSAPQKSQWTEDQPPNPNRKFNLLVHLSPVRMRGHPSQVPCLCLSVCLSVWWSQPASQQELEE
jgi:hypothetical protein